jgi:hypothetical protein
MELIMHDGLNRLSRLALEMKEGWILIVKWGSHPSLNILKPIMSRELRHWELATNQGNREVPKPGH